MGFAEFTSGPSGGEPPGVTPRGIDASRGEGGFWARIAFQDTNRPTRYGFIQQYRIFDPAAGTGLGGNPSKGDVAFKDANVNSPPGEQSLWNADGTGPVTTVYAVNGQVKGVPQGFVVNWATESNGNQGVPIGAFVWIRRGETYSDPDLNTYCDDATFDYNFPLIWFGLTKAAVMTGDASYVVDHVTTADHISCPIQSNTTTIIVYNWAGWSATGSGVKSMFIMVDFTVSSGSIGHANFIQGPCGS
jgi:hypothetical protein